MKRLEIYDETGNVGYSFPFGQKKRPSSAIDGRAQEYR
jgi:hypothetical protein